MTLIFVFSQTQASREAINFAKGDGLIHLAGEFRIGESSSRSPLEMLTIVNLYGRSLTTAPDRWYCSHK